MSRYRDLRRADDIVEAMPSDTAASERARRHAAVLVASRPTKAADRARELRTEPEPSPDHIEELVAIEAALTVDARCSECGRALSDPVSQARGMGSDCARGTS